MAPQKPARFVEMPRIYDGREWGNGAILGPDFNIDKKTKRLEIKDCRWGKFYYSVSLKPVLVINSRRSDDFKFLADGFHRDYKVYFDTVTRTLFGFDFHNSKDPEFDIPQALVELGEFLDKNPNPELEKYISIRDFKKTAYLGESRKRNALSTLVNAKGKDLTMEDIKVLNDAMNDGLIESAPAMIYSSGSYIEWRDPYGRAHRPNNLPAKEWIGEDKNPEAFGSKEYLIRGQNHRTDGPAIIDRPDIIAWYRDGKFYFVNMVGDSLNSDRMIVKDLATYKALIKQYFPEADADYWAGNIIEGKIFPRDGGAIFQP
jgi:hypothetical protein